MKKQTIDSVGVVAVFATALALVGIIASSSTPAVAASNTGEVIEHAEFSVTTATAVEFKPDSGKRTSHFSCEVNDAEGCTLYIGDSTVSSTDFGESLTAGEKFGGPHGKEYGIAGTETCDVHCRFVVSGAL